MLVKLSLDKRADLHSYLFPGHPEEHEEIAPTEETESILRMSGQARAPTPRQLQEAETITSLKQWRTTLYTYFRKCPYNYFFLKSITKWDPTAQHYGMVAETTGLKRDPAELMEDLMNFMNMVGGFLPQCYITERFQNSTKSFEEMWEIIQEYYDAELSSSSFLELANITKNDTETYHIANIANGWLTMQGSI